MGKEYIIDGNNFSNFEGFIKEFNEKVFRSDYWHGNLDTLNDMLWGGYGTPDEKENFVIIWKNSHKSSEDLGHKATLEWLESGFPKIDPTNENTWKLRMELAKRNEGETLFNTVINIILGRPNIILKLE